MLNNDNSNIEGSFPVNGEETPITHQPIDQIDANEWHRVPSSKLYEHRSTLMNRIYMVSSMKNGAEMAIQLQRGINHIDSILSSRSSERIDLI